MEKFNFKKEAIQLVLILIPIIYILSVWQSLPERVPTHFDLHGQANDWGSKEAIFILPGLSLFVYLLLLFLPLIDPKKMSDEFIRTNLFKIRLVITAFFSGLSVLITYISLNGANTHLIRIMPISVLLLMALMGNFMLNIKPNWFVGVRTPWTLSSEYVWKQTHLVLGRIWFFGGLFCAVLAFISSDEWLPGIILVFALGSSLFAVVYSFVLYKLEEKRNASHS